MRRIPKASGSSRAGSAPVFAALGDKTRLWLVSRLCDAGPLSIARLTAGAKVTRQGRGRERRWQLNQQRLADARLYLDQISTQWDAALNRLRAYLED